jgi:hypothetical protein
MALKALLKVDPDARRPKKLRNRPSRTARSKL